jgi:hypothetical protein
MVILSLKNAFSHPEVAPGQYYPQFPVFLQRINILSKATFWFGTLKFAF